ncbi:MAG: ATP-binding cassette domain-containing protein [Pseudomonadota bacterium]
MKLEAENLTKAYHQHEVVNIKNVAFGAKGLEGLIGPNGAGKSTLMGLLTRRIAPTSGQIRLDTGNGVKALNPLKSHEVARIGLIKTNQRIQGFDSLTIRDSLRLAVTPPKEEGLMSVFAGGRDTDEVEENVSRYIEAFPFTDRNGYARSGGEKKLVDILRCLIAEPKLLLMDEPTAGLPEDITRTVMDMVREKVAGGKMRVVVVEHDLPLIWEYCDYVHFLSEGSILFEGAPEEVKSNRVVAEKYMGV